MSEGLWLDDFLPEEGLIKNVLAVELHTEDEYERMFIDFTQDLYDRGIIAKEHCYYMQYDFLLNGYDWIDSDGYQDEEEDD